MKDIGPTYVIVGHLVIQVRSDGGHADSKIGQVRMAEKTQ